MLLLLSLPPTVSIRLLLLANFAAATPGNHNHCSVEAEKREVNLSDIYTTYRWLSCVSHDFRSLGRESTPPATVH